MSTIPDFVSIDFCYVEQPTWLFADGVVLENAWEHWWQLGRALVKISLCYVTTVVRVFGFVVVVNLEGEQFLSAWVSVDMLWRFGSDDWNVCRYDVVDLMVHDRRGFAHLVLGFCKVLLVTTFKLCDFVDVELELLDLGGQFFLLFS